MVKQYVVLLFILFILIVSGCIKQEKLVILPFPEEFYQNYLYKDTSITFRNYLVKGYDEKKEKEIYEYVKSEYKKFDTSKKSFQIVFFRANADLSDDFGKTGSGKWPNEWYSLYGSNLLYEFTWHNGIFLGVNHYIQGVCENFYDKSKW